MKTHKKIINLFQQIDMKASIDDIVEIEMKFAEIVAKAGYNHFKLYYGEDFDIRKYKRYNHIESILTPHRVIKDKEMFKQLIKLKNEQSI